MTTVVSTSKLQPAVTLDRIHWEVWSFKQPKPGTVKTIQGAFTLYGFCPDGDRVFDKESVGVDLPNVDEVIINNHVVKGGTVEGFATDYAAEVAQLNTEYLAGNISDAKLMAYIELVMARSAEIVGKLTISSVE